MVHSSKRQRNSVVCGPKREAQMARRRDSRVEYRPTAEAVMADRPKESRKEQASGYPAVGEGKQDNGHSSLSQDSVTSTGEVISPNGIRLWGMW